MRVLFLHNNFPSQFGPLARFMKNRGHDVAFGTQWPGKPPEWLRMVRFKPHREVNEKQHPYLRFTEEAVLAGQAFARAAWELKKEGYAPDVVAAHAGMRDRGCTSATSGRGRSTSATSSGTTGRPARTSASCPP